jgi:amino acid adenylation domain-containing protein
MIVDQYGLTPIQQGMLFHYVNAEHSGVDIEQLVIEYKEPPDISILERAWQATIQKHPVLRTSFRWEEFPEPIQQVHDRVRVQIEKKTFCSESQVASFITADRQRGFDLRQPPLMRLTFFGSNIGSSQLVWTLHHILMDGRAFIIVLNQVEQYYRDLLSGATPDITTEILYRPYVEWTRQRDLTGADDFWREKLSGLTAPTRLPFEPDYLPKNGSILGEIEAQLSASVTAALRLIARQNDVTLNTVVMGIWAILLARISGESEVVFGATKTTRRASIAGADSIVGLFLNTVPVRIAVRSTTPVVEMLKQLRREWVSLRQYEHTPLIQIKRASGFPSAAPLFDSLVVFESQRFDTALAATGPQWRDRGIRWFEQTGFGLTLLAYGDAALTLKLEFDAQRFGRTTAQRILTHVIQACTSVATNPDDTIGRLAIIPHEERQLLVVDWNRTESEYPRELPLAALVESQVAETPNATAVVFGRQSLTYRELNERANQLARELVKCGAKPNELVGVCIERSLEMLIALLAVAKSGAGYLPLDPYLPAARLQHMIDDSGLGVIVTQRNLQSELPRFLGRIVTMDSNEWHVNRSDNLDVAVKPEHVAYVIYTSGSTGKPKGVVVSYGSLLNVLWAVKGLLKFDASDRLLAVTTISFDIAGADIWLPWLVGATTILASRESAADGAQLGELIKRHDITFMQATPVTWWLLLGAGWRGKSDLQIVCTGEAMPRKLASQLVPMVGKLWNLYGPTETAIWSTGYLVVDGQAPVLIGRPIDNTQCYILDSHREPVPIGSIGDLYIAGDGLARGYLNRPELTAEKFVPNPFNREPGSRMYHTGDLARYRPDGNIECLGRTDDQVKIRGFRIELGEIETALKQHPGICQPVVVAREDIPGEKRLVAYFVPVGAAAPERSELRRLLKQQLPEYMVPTEYVALTNFPISANGKIDRKALPPPGRSDEVSSLDSYAAPRNDTERKLVEIMSRVLCLDRIGIDVDFFAIGGHSLAAMRVISLIKSEMNIDLPVRTLFKATTASQIAAIIIESSDSGKTLSSDELRTCIAIQANGSNFPLFCVARPNVNALGYLFLSRHLGPDQPVFGLQRQMPEDPQVEFTPEQIRETAEEYIRAMRSVQPHGPYYLVGQCQGAYIAFEMVRRLESQGDCIGMLGMLDVWPEENTRHKLLFFVHSYVHKLLNALRRKAAKEVVALAAPLADRRHGEGEALSTAYAGDSRTPLWKLYWPGPDFRPVVISSKIVVFRVASQPVYRIRDRAMGWRNRTVGPVEVEDIPGGHLTLLREPHVHVLAERIRRHMGDSAEGVL